MKIAIYSDPLTGKGGGTRVVIALANHLHADIITSGFDTKLKKQLNRKLKVIDIGNFFIHKFFSFGYLFEAPLRFLFSKKYQYDLNIFVGSYSIFASRKAATNIYLCFTPNRIMYDLRAWKYANSPIQKQIVYFIHNLLFNTIDQHIVKNNFVKIIAQTKTVQDRIKRYYKKNSSIIYSPLDTSHYKFNIIGDYYLSVSRLVPEKRMDLIAKAFVKMPHEKLVMIGNGSEKSTIQTIIKNSKNITLLTNVEDAELIEHYANCKAVIYFPIAEDFGLVPLEANASGKVCIAANEGGCRETIQHGKTGYLVAPTTDALIKIIKNLSVQTLLSMKDTCIKRAQEFDITHCAHKWQILVNSVYNNPNKKAAI